MIPTLADLPELHKVLQMAVTGLTDEPVVLWHEVAPPEPIPSPKPKSMRTTKAEWSRLGQDAGVLLRTVAFVSFGGESIAIRVDSRVDGSTYQFATHLPNWSPIPTSQTSAMAKVGPAETMEWFGFEFGYLNCGGWSIFDGLSRVLSRLMDCEGDLDLLIAEESVAMTVERMIPLWRTSPGWSRLLDRADHLIRADSANPGHDHRLIARYHYGSLAFVESLTPGRDSLCGELDRKLRRITITSNTTCQACGEEGRYLPLEKEQVLCDSCRTP